jgi:hypothetical protein
MAGQRKAESDSFLPDQQRADTLAWYGGVKVHAPNLNKLASEIDNLRADLRHPPGLHTFVVVTDDRHLATH